MNNRFLPRYCAFMKTIFCISVVGSSTTTLTMIFLHPLIKDYKDYIDAEGLMPLPTSDLQLEMKALREAYNQFSQLQNHERLYRQHHHPRIRPQLSQTSSQKSVTRQSSLGDSKARSEDKVSLGPSESNMSPATALNLSPALVPQRSHLTGEAFSFKDTQPLSADKPLNKSVDLASLDSSDTYASCQTHPCLSQGDLTSADDLLDCTDDKLYNFEAVANARTGSIMDFLDYESTNKLYVNPLQKSDSDAIKLQKKLSVSSIGIRGNISTGASPRTMSKVKKSASGGFNGGASKYSNMSDLVSTLIMARDTGNKKPNSNYNQKSESVNLIDGLDEDEDDSAGQVPSCGSNVLGMSSGGTGGGVPKHRKTRFQQQSSANSDAGNRKPGDALTTANVMLAQEGLFMGAGGGGLSTSSGGSSSTITGSQVSVEPVAASPLNPSASMKVKCRRASFMPARSLASATKKINQHLFGVGSGTGSGSCTGSATMTLAMKREASGKKSLSMSIESLDSNATSTVGPEQPLPSSNLSAAGHRRSKSILKNKSERLPNKFSSADPENERLLMDNSSAPDNGVGCDCEYSPQRTLIHAKSVATLSMTPTSAAGGGVGTGLRQTRPMFVHQRSTPDATNSASPKTTAKYQSPRHTETELATIRQHRQQKMFKETALQGSFGESPIFVYHCCWPVIFSRSDYNSLLIAESESTTIQNCTDREEDFGGMDENRSLLERKMNASAQKKSSS